MLIISIRFTQRPLESQSKPIYILKISISFHMGYKKNRRLLFRMPHVSLELKILLKLHRICQFVQKLKISSKSSRNFYINSYLPQIARGTR